MMGRLQVFSGNSNLPLAREIVAHLNLNLGGALVGTFRNGETRVRIEENVRGSDVFVIQSMSNPVDHHLMELLIMVDALRRASAARITVVVPYYGYAKQEKKTAGREPITAKLVANMIMTAGATSPVDDGPARSRYRGLLRYSGRSPASRSDHGRTLPFPKDLLNVVAVSPDAGGVNRANRFRERLGAGLAIISKQRPEPDVVEAIDMVGDVDGKIAIIVDDMISTGGTLVEAAHSLARTRCDGRVCVCHTWHLRWNGFQRDLRVRTQANRCHEYDPAAARSGGGTNRSYQCCVIVRGSDHAYS